MKVKAVSVFRERGLRAGVSRRAEPQCLVGNANIERKTDTMKSYILLKPEAVQSQIITAPAEAKPSVLFIGLDVHNDSIAVSIAPGDSTEVRRYGIIGGEHDDVLKLVKKLQAAHPGGILKICYEAGPRGFALCRCLRSHGLDCLLVCPSQVPRKPGERVKTDRRDADQLARLLRAGQSKAINPPLPRIDHRTGHPGSANRSPQSFFWAHFVSASVG